MELGQLYQFILMLVLIGVISAVGIILLDRLGGADGVGGTASTAVNNTRDAIATIPNTWLGIIVIVGIMAVLLVLVIRSFSPGRGR